MSDNGPFDPYAIRRYGCPAPGACPGSVHLGELHQLEHSVELGHLFGEGLLDVRRAHAALAYVHEQLQVHALVADLDLAEDGDEVPCDGEDCISACH